jgi:periplasmic divalent cation tolerance protein
MSTEVMVVFSTAPNEEVAGTIAAALVEAKLAACVNLVPGVRSLYWWEGELHNDAEVMLVCKTDATRLDELTETLRRVHPYDCPEVVALDVAGGCVDYLAWVSDVVARK